MSTTVKDSIMSYIGYPSAADDVFVLSGYKMTTQTIVLELQGIKFNDFRIDAKKFASDLKTLI